MVLDCLWWAYRKVPWSPRSGLSSTTTPTTDGRWDCRPRAWCAGEEAEYSVVVLGAPRHRPWVLLYCEHFSFNENISFHSSVFPFLTVRIHYIGTSHQDDQRRRTRSDLRRRRSRIRIARRPTCTTSRLDPFKCQP